MELKIKMKEEEEWYDSFYQVYATYLMKIPSISDIYRIAQKKVYESTSTDHLTHIFRIINQVRGLFPFLTKAVTVVGRYQSHRQNEFRELYRIISIELVNIYSYLKFLVGKILT